MPYFYLFGDLFGWIIGKCNLCPPSETPPEAGGRTEDKGALQARAARAVVTAVASSNGHVGRKAGE